MGMMVALGELQKHLGPDTRVSGTADLLDERIETTAQYTENRYDPAVTPTEGIDLNENGQIDKLPFGQRYWTGVWKHRASNNGSTPGISPTPIADVSAADLEAADCIICGAPTWNTGADDMRSGE